MEEVVFISTSGIYTQKVAMLLEKIIEIIYSANITCFTPSSYQIKPLNTHFEQTNHAICIQSAENMIPSEENNDFWYEAGALEMQMTNTNGTFLAYLFCTPNQSYRAISESIKVYTYVNNANDDVEQLKKLLNALNDSLNTANQMDSVTIDNAVDSYWSTHIKDFHELGDKVLTIASRHLDKNRINTKSSQVNKNENLMTISLEHNNFLEKVRTPYDLPNFFTKVLKNNIVDKWKLQNSEDKRFDVHRVMVNNTRFSTFVVFTDGKRVVLFDRRKDKKNTRIELNSLDVFGSVQFENKTIINKIKSVQFLNSDIQHIEIIDGIAVEDNDAKADGNERETAVMLGICVTMKAEDLKLALSDTDNDEIVLYDALELFNSSIKKDVDAKESLTSKASLGVQHIFNRYSYEV